MEPCAAPSVPLADFLRLSVWGRALDAAQRAVVLAAAQERRVPAGCCVARMGEPAGHWLGIVEGLVKMSVLAADGRTASLTGAAAGAWFGEGSVLKGVPFRYDVVALRDTRLALIPRATFDWLRAHSLPFNHYLQDLLNARLSLFIGLLEFDRLLGPDARVARCLASLYTPELFPDPGPSLALTQHELALLAGVSRQRANVALGRLAAEGLLRVQRCGITVLDLDGLRGFADRQGGDDSP